MITELRKIKRGLVRQSFPELQTTLRPVYLTLRFLDHEGAEASTHNSRYDYIIVDPKALDLSLDAKVGLLAHELAHCVIDRSRSPDWFAFINVLYNNSTTIERYEERLADRLAVERGYGKQLLQLNTEWGVDSLGLPNREIQRMVASGRYPVHSLTLL